ncbi:hypothetical protein [Paenibacillus qinlingensis]|uniref:DUF5666 domain-containing protein n=1 Tax=Paenibacillus qinlingensis TaxID=1837343 RepID=A0ABU1P7M1_9BACL|nr:hypothetical protein [Paenibacillus qinlingensis]MDR6555182.1 hypothetical protein [Paenibacillus qinlingensis]
MFSKMRITLIAIIIAALTICGWTAYAATSSSSATSTTILGKLTTLTEDTITLHTDTGDQTVPLATSVWVYLNDEKAQLRDLHTGDEIDVILNNKKQAAYVKGASATAISSGATPSVSPVPSESPTPVAVPVPSSSAAPSSSAEPTSSPTKVGNKPAASPPTNRSNLKDVDISVDGQHFNFHLKQTKGAHGSQYDLSIQSPHAGRIHLTGSQAQAWISKLLGSIDLSAPDAREIVSQQLAKQYNLEASKLNVHLNVHANDQEDDKEVEKKHDKDDDKKPQKDKNNDKKPGNNNKND